MSGAWLVKSGTIGTYVQSGSWSQSIALVLGREGSSRVRIAGGRVVKALVEGERFESMRQSS
jgi:hypothetical protein